MSTVSSSVHALYLHVPFCVQRCRYCDFKTSAVNRGDPVVDEYMGALVDAVRACAATGVIDDVRTAYIGGGTPTFAGDGLTRLVEAVRQSCPSIVEFSSEANPESLTVQLAEDLRSAGLTRLSLGVQSLEDAELARLGRAHDANGARKAMRAAVDAGLDLSCDLMCGIPLQSHQSWERSLAGVLEGGACHVSCYPLTVEEGTPLERSIEQGKEHAPDEDFQADLMVAASDFLEGSGLERYEVASYAAAGKRCLHNLVYWSGKEYLGLGAGASSMLSPHTLGMLNECVTISYGNGAPDLSEARSRIRIALTGSAHEFAMNWNGAALMSADFEQLTLREAAAEDLMLAMRTTDGITPALFERALESGIPTPALADACERAVSSGLARCRGRTAISPTRTGWLLGNRLYGMFWDLAAD